MSKFTPCGNRVLVQACSDEPGQENKTGIIIPDKIGVGPMVFKCDVIAVGDPVKRCKVGDIVVVPLAGYELFIDRTSYRVMPEDDILGVLEESKILLS